MKPESGKRAGLSLGLAAVSAVLAGVFLTGCGSSADSGKTVIEIVQYKPEAADYFEALEEEFNTTHDDIELKISSPKEEQL